MLLKDGRILDGSIINSPKGLRIERSDQYAEVTRDEVIAMRSYDEQLSWQRVQERKLAPHFLDPWGGFLDAGTSAARGNADVTTVSVGFNAVRTTVKDKLTLVFNGLYGRNSTNQPAAVTADLRRGGLRYERNLNKRQFGFVSLDAESDALQRLELRTVGGLGFGRHLVNTPRNTFDIFAGSTVNRENFTHRIRLTGEALLSEESTHRINSILTLRQKVGVFPNLTDTGEYRMTFDSGAVTTLLRWLSWQISVSDRFISDPPVGPFATTFSSQPAFGSTSSPTNKHENSRCSNLRWP